jgi:hypothetical protein
MNRNSTIAAAVAAVLASGVSSYALAVPTLAQAQSPNTVLYIAGSSAAKNAVLAALEVDLCGGVSNALTFSSSGDTNFFAVSCIPATSTGVTGANGSNVFTVYYRDEGGSVTGALPIVSGKPINQLNLAAASGAGPAYVISVTGSSAINGIDDSFSTGVVKEPVQLGITDVEPGALIQDNYPAAYLPSVYGTASASQLAGLTQNTLFSQVFGIFVNTSGGQFGTLTCQGQPASATNTCLSLSKETITNLLQGNITNWSGAPTTAGTAAASSLAVKIVNREQGSGSRTSQAIYFTDDECNPSANSISDPAGPTGDYFSTGNVLTAAGSVPGAITYASIDNAGSGAPNMTLVAINGVAATNLNAAAGLYDDWYEATMVGPISGLTASQNSLASFLMTEFQNGNTAPHAADIVLIPGAGTNTTPGLPVSGTSNAFGGATTIYVNAFTRGGVSCNTPSNAL